jgi:hypothetical protein
MMKKNIGTHDAVLGKNMIKTRLKVVMSVLSKNKIAIHVPGRYCLHIRYINGYDPLEWSIDIEYCRS